MEYKFTEKELLDIGFIKCNVTKEESGGSAFSYFIFEPYNCDTASLISSVVEEGDLTVEFFNLRKCGQFLSRDFVDYFCDYFSNINQR